jgi:LacI family transcriptional regulator
MNDEATSFTLVEHLIKSGFKRIGIITGGDHLNICKSRIKGYMNALQTFGTEIDENLIIKSGMSYQEGRVGFQKLMSLGIKPDAIFATSDQIALAVYSEAKRMGLQIGNDLGIAAFSCDPLLGLLEPAITGLNLKGFEMGSMSAQLCISDIENENKNLKTRTETLSNEMIIRKSSIKSIGLDNDKLNELMNKNKFTEENLVYIY